MFKTALITTTLVISNWGLAQTPQGELVDFSSSDTTRTEIHKVWDNWFISVGADAPSVQSVDRSKDLKITTSCKDSTDILWNQLKTGVRAMYSGLSVKGVYWNGVPTSKHLFDGENGIYDRGFNQLNLHADILFNASNLICDYQEQREWNLIPSTPFTQFSFKEMEQIQHSAIDINLNIRGTFVGKHVNTDNRIKDGKFSATLGFSYDIPGSQKGNVQIPINDNLWNEHCNHMIYLNRQEN